MGVGRGYYLAPFVGMERKRWRREREEHQIVMGSAGRERESNSIFWEGSYSHCVSESSLLIWEF